ncbi:maleylpyruvate isomerase family mycothiol-dependent enzyme [Asanoa sp. NPDC049573]|uniref:maleylpyruvate isomerase N-terminal domain-containing protein n=1 Tax=Asanoa sp. NPDC049573 TaxID=3155396 RepID=UPI00341FA90A
MNFSDHLRLIDERSVAFCAAVAAAPSLDVWVPTCPEWTLFDLARHIGEGRWAWAATVAAGPDATGKATASDAPAAPDDRAALLDWLAAATHALVSALSEAGPDRGCWTWWGTSQSPQNCAAVARHQLQQMAVHTYDAQLAIGAVASIPDDVALDGVEEFVFTCCTGDSWPHKPATIDYHVTDGGSWRLWLLAEGARAARLPASGATVTDPADASAAGTATELVLFLHGRAPLDSLEVEGDRGVFDLLVAWEPA